MKEKIQLLIQAEHLTQSRLAEMLEIQPANVSHILSGRSKPGFELLQRILRRFPRLNPDWLLLDAESMYRPGMESPTAEAALPISERPAPNLDSLFPGAIPAIEQPSAGATPPASGHTPQLEPPTSPTATRPFVTRGRGHVVRVVLFYDDQTFESFESN